MKDYSQNAILNLAILGHGGSGKTTLLNILAELTGVTRHSAFSGSAFFKEYTRHCRLDAKPIPECSQILTSDDVTDYILI